MKVTRDKSFWLFLCWLLVCSIFLYGTSALAQSPLVDKLKEYPASMRIEDMPVSTVMRAISRQTGINIFVANNISDTITIEMQDLTLYDIFHLILDTKKLHFTEKNNIVIIEKEADYKGELKDVSTVKLCTKYSKAADFLGQLDVLLSPNGSLTSSVRGDCLVVRDSETNIARIKQILEELDQPIPQVHIEARIVTMGQEAIRRLGVKWNYDNLQTNPSISASSDLSVTNTSTLAFGLLQDNLQLNVELQAMQQDNMLQILSAPSILVLDGNAAEIKQGQEVPYTSQSGDLVNTSFREATLSLKVTPKVLQDNFIVLDVTVTNDSVDETSSSSEPLINKQEIATNLFLENGVTVVIGGILLQKEDKQTGGVPVLSKIPLLGNLFKNSENKDTEAELVVFLTPTIVTMPTMLKERTPAAPEKKNLFPTANSDGKMKKEIE